MKIIFIFIMFLNNYHCAYCQNVTSLVTLADCVGTNFSEIVISKLNVEFGEKHTEAGNTQTEKAGMQSQMSAKFEKIIFKLNIMFWMQRVTIALILSIITFIIWDRQVGKKHQ